MPSPFATWGLPVAAGVQRPAGEPLKLAELRPRRVLCAAVGAEGARLRCGWPRRSRRWRPGRGLGAGRKRPPSTWRGKGQERVLQRDAISTSKGWGGRRDSNPRSPGPQPGALTARLRPPGSTCPAAGTSANGPQADARRGRTASHGSSVLSLARPQGGGQREEAQAQRGERTSEAASAAAEAPYWPPYLMRRMGSLRREPPDGPGRAPVWGRPSGRWPRFISMSSAILARQASAPRFWTPQTLQGPL